ncbi:Reticulocyte-binding protein 2 a [Chlorella vulgaris]
MGRELQSQDRQQHEQRRGGKRKRTLEPQAQPEQQEGTDLEHQLIQITKQNRKEKRQQGIQDPRQQQQAPVQGVGLQLGQQQQQQQLEWKPKKRRHVPDVDIQTEHKKQKKQADSRELGRAAPQQQGEEQAQLKQLHKAERKAKRQQKREEEARQQWEQEEEERVKQLQKAQKKAKRQQKREEEARQQWEQEEEERVKQLQKAQKKAKRQQKREEEARQQQEQEEEEQVKQLQKAQKKAKRQQKREEEARQQQEQEEEEQVKQLQKAQKKAKRQQKREEEARQQQEQEEEEQVKQLQKAQKKAKRQQKREEEARQQREQEEEQGRPQQEQQEEPEAIPASSLEPSASQRAPASAAAGASTTGGFKFWSEADAARLVQCVEDDHQHLGEATLDWRAVAAHFGRSTQAVRSKYRHLKLVEEHGTEVFARGRSARAPISYSYMALYALSTLPDQSGTGSEVCAVVERYPVFQPRLDRTFRPDCTGVFRWQQRIREELSHQCIFRATGTKRGGEMVWQLDLSSIDEIPRNLRKKVAEMKLAGAPHMGKHGNSNG